VRRRAAAASRLVGLALPQEAEEIWRYSGIDRFALDLFAPAVTGAAPSGHAEALDRAKELAEPFGPRSALVVALHGKVLSAETGPGTPPALLAMAGEGGGGGDEEQDAFSVLHDAFVPDVVAVNVPDGAALSAPVVVVHLVDPAARPGPEQAPASFPETVVRIGRGAEGGVIELSATVREGSDGPALVVPVTDLEVGDGGRLSYANLQVLGEAATQVGTQRSRVGRDGSLRSFTVGLGGAYARVRTDSDLVGQGANSALLAAYLGTGDQVHDFRTLQDHHAPRTDSELLFTGAVADRARSVYSGLIRIRHGARKADARQTNHNLVLSEGAHADSVPNLDIDENDVKCSHASTVGPIDQEQRYYLESRGIEPAVAERLIVLGFFSDIAARSSFPEVGRWVSQSVARRLAGRLPAEQERATAGAAPEGAAGG
jgi:Fe-S cluster assembly protein SufD